MDDIIESINENKKRIENVAIKIKCTTSMDGYVYIQK